MKKRQRLRSESWGTSLYKDRGKRGVSKRRRARRRGKGAVGDEKGKDLSHRTKGVRGLKVQMGGI